MLLPLATPALPVRGPHPPQGAYPPLSGVGSPFHEHRGGPGSIRGRRVLWAERPGGVDPAWVARGHCLVSGGSAEPRWDCQSPGKPQAATHQGRKCRSSPAGGSWRRILASVETVSGQWPGTQPRATGDPQGALPQGRHVGPTPLRAHPAHTCFSCLGHRGGGLLPTSQLGKARLGRKRSSVLPSSCRGLPEACAALAVCGPLHLPESLWQK